VCYLQALFSSVIWRGFGVRRKAKSPQFKPLPDNEKEICRRVAAVRRFQGLNQTELARRVGLTRDQLANIEAMRVALKFGTALAICRAIDINPNWLYSGAGPQGPMLEFNDPLCLAVLDVVPASDRFSSVWTGFGNSLLELSTLHTRRIGRQGREQEQSLTDTGPLVVPLEYWGAEADQKNDLTRSSLKRKNKGVKSEIQKLIEQVKRKTSKPGAKSNLARELHVAPARISEWLSGEKEPGGDYTLRLRNWVTPPERPTK
jgi:DNA-binding XRE family transcriptional regulator